MKETPKDNSNRRDFLKLAAVAAPGAVAATALGTTQAEAAAPVDETRLQDTAHTRAYLDSARF
ncbi:twin-arginine translocation signal domain-containing protein [Rhodobacteraceae bacterium F11138]|nr:twin-arginine translocation signal domain-containing protein [Rhodobacteraceae bacterium F11138]